MAPVLSSEPDRVDCLCRWTWKKWTALLFVVEINNMYPSTNGALFSDYRLCSAKNGERAREEMERDPPASEARCRGWFRLGARQMGICLFQFQKTLTAVSTRGPVHMPVKTLVTTWWWELDHLAQATFDTKVSAFCNRSKNQSHKRSPGPLSS